MRTALSFLIPALPGLALFSGCNPMEDIPGFGDDKKKIDFAPSVSDWETKIYKNHEDF